MSFHNDKEERNTVPPVLGRQGPSFRKSSTFGKAPAFSKAAGGIMERIKGLSRRDLGLVVLGLSALIMAPVAEYMMSRPPMDNTLTAGFGSRGMGDVSSIYEPGIHGLSQGSPDGSGEVIVPLSARDPLSLILGAAKPAPPPMPSAPPSSSLRDTVRDAGREAFSAAVKSGGAPTVIPKMASALRGVASFSGGGETSRTSGSLSGGQISADAKKASGKSASRSMVGPVAPAGYKGVAMTPNSASRGAFEKLRAQAGAAADNFTTGSAVLGLDKAAAASVNAGAGDGGLGAGKDGDKTKSPSNSSARDQKSHSPKESLAEMLNRKRAEKALEWEMYKKYEIPKKLIEAVLSGVGTSLTSFAKSFTDGLTGQGGGSSPTWACFDVVPKTTDCVPANARGIKFTSTNKEEVTSLNSNGKCPCGYGIYTGTGGPSGGTAGSSPTGTNPDGSPGGVRPPVTHSQNHAAQLKGDMDTVLGNLARAVKKTQKERRLGGFLDTSRGTAILVAGDSEKRAEGLAEKFLKETETLLRDANSVDTAVEGYATAIKDSGDKLSASESVLSDFKRKVEAVDTAGRRTVAGSGKVRGVAEGGDVSSFLDEIKEEIDRHARLISDIKARIPRHNTIAGFYGTQAGLIRQNASAIKRDTSLHLQASVAAHNELKGYVKEYESQGRLDPEEKEKKAVEAFRVLAGGRQLRFNPAGAAPVVEQPVVEPTGESTLKTDSLYALAMPSDLRDGIAGVKQADAVIVEDALVDRLISYRGCDVDKLWNDHKVEDSKTRDDEDASWIKTSPHLNYSRIMGEEGFTIPEIEAPTNIVTLVMRARDEIPWDVGEVKLLLEAEVAGVDSAPKITVWTNRLKTYGIDLGDKPPAGDGDQKPPAGDGDQKPPDPPATGTPLQQARANAEAVLGKMNTQVDIASSRYSEFESRYGKRCTDGKHPRCNVFMTAANGNMKEMAVNKTEVEKYAAQLKEGKGADGQPLTQDDITRMNSRIAAIGKEMDPTFPESLPRRFEANMQSAAGEVGSASVKPPKPPADQKPPAGQKPPPPADSVGDLWLYNGPERIQAYDDKGNQILYWACNGTRSPKPTWQIVGESMIYGGAYAGYTIFGGDPRTLERCSGKWEKKHATVFVETFHLAPPGEIPNFNMRGLEPYKERVWISKSAANDTEAEYRQAGWQMRDRGEFKLESIANCEYNTATKKWEFKNVSLRRDKGPGTAGFTAGGGVKASIKLVEISGQASYSRTWTKYTFGVQVPYPKFEGRECK